MNATTLHEGLKPTNFTEMGLVNLICFIFPFGIWPTPSPKNYVFELTVLHIREPRNKTIMSRLFRTILKDRV